MLTFIYALLTDKHVMTMLVCLRNVKVIWLVLIFKNNLKPSVTANMNRFNGIAIGIKIIKNKLPRCITFFISTLNMAISGSCMQKRYDKIKYAFINSLVHVNMKTCQFLNRTNYISGRNGLWNFSILSIKNLLKCSPNSFKIEHKLHDFYAFVQINLEILTYQGGMFQSPVRYRWKVFQDNNRHKTNLSGEYRP